MEVFDGFDHFPAPRGGTVVTIGNFDGVHLGHARLIAAAREAAAARGAPAVVATFEPHPLEIVAPRRAPERLTTRAEKLALLGQHGVDAVIVLRSDRRLIDTPAEEFLVQLAECCRPAAIVEGPTFNFGRGRAGSVETLRQHAGRLGYEVRVVNELACEALPDRPNISSSAIRAALTAGDLERASAMLGRPYRIAGVVGHGHHRGVELGFPTANLEGVPHLVPAQAVYSGIAQLEDGTLHLAAVNIGPQPTFDQPESRIEAHLLDHTGSLRGQRLGLYLLRRLRGQRRFAGPEELIEQLRRDVEQTRAQAPQREALRHRPLLPL